jgi:hypothetical protein
VKKLLLTPLAVFLVAGLMAAPAVADGGPTSNVAVYNNVKVVKNLKTVEYFKAYHGVKPAAKKAYTRAIGNVVIKNNGNNPKYVECVVVFKQVRNAGSNIVGEALVNATVPAGGTRKRDFSILGGNEGGNVVVNLDVCWSASV